MSEQILKAWLIEQGAIDENVESLQQITRLDLSGRKLKKLPENFGRLTALVALNLSNNALHVLPESMTKLKKLSTLDIRRNKFHTLPSLLASLELRSLNASTNTLSDVSVLKACPSIRVLDLSNNVLKNIDDALTSANEIRTLNLSSNLIDDVYEIFKNLKNLQRLNLGDNVIREIPSSVGNLEFLEELDMADNHIQKIDDSIFGLDLVRIDLSSNLITYLYLHHLELLEIITLDENPLRKFIIDDNFAPYLKELSCDSCGLKNFLLPQSEYIELLCYSSNAITSIPRDIERYSQLKELDIDGNKIEELPDSLANFSFLNTLYIDKNPLSEAAKKIITILDPEICDINMKTGITIQKAQDTDLSQMADLLSVLFAIESDFTIDYKKQFTGIKRLYDYEFSDLLVAKYEGNVIGMITMQRLISSAEGDYVGQIEDLVVHEEYRKMGVGSRLINKMRSLAIEYGYKRIQLAADVENHNALQFYNRRGFKKTQLNIYHYIV